MIEDRLPMLFYGYDFSFKNADIQAAEQGFAELCAAKGLPFLTSYSTLSQRADYRAALEAVDGVHPSGEGYQIMADQVADWSAWQALL